MSVSCTPGDLVNATNSLQQLTERQQLAAQTYLLMVKADLNLTPGQLVDLAKCFICRGEKELLAMQTYLMCQIANGGSGPGTCVNQTGTGSPINVVTPAFSGQVFIATDTGLIWQASSLLLSSWVIISQGAIWTPQKTSLSTGAIQSPIKDSAVDAIYIPQVTDTAEDVDFSAGTFGISMNIFSIPKMVIIHGSLMLDGTGLQTLDAPLLQSTDNSMSLTSNNLATISLPVFTNTGIGNFSFQSGATATLNLPALTAVGDRIEAQDNVLTSVSIPSFVWSGNKRLNFSNNLLPQAQVDALLQAAVTGHMTGGELFLNGTGNATPSGAGLINKASLIAAGVDCRTN